MGKYSIQKFSKTLTLLFATDDNEISGTYSLNGILKGILVNAPDLDSTNTLKVDILDEDDFVLFSKASLAKSTKHAIVVDANNFPLELPLTGTVKVKFTTSGAQTANRAIPFKLLIER